MPRPSIHRSVAPGLLLACACIATATVARAATPETVNVSPTDTLSTWQTPILAVGTGLDRGTCVEDVSCDTVRIVVEPGDYTGKRVTIGIDWTLPTNDWDLFVFRDRVDGEAVGASHDFIPQNHEGVGVTIDQVLSAPRVYVAQVVGAEFVAPEQLTGTVHVEPALPPRTASRLYASDVRFTASVTVAAPGAARDCEPSLRVDTRGNCYVGGIRGVPGGVDLWRFDLDPASAGYDPELRHPVYLGQPDAFAAEDTTGGRDGGGDIDIATSFPSSAGETPVVTIVSLAAANISSARSFDRGDNFALSPAVANVPADDRQWIEAAGADTVYLLYRAPIPATGLFAQRSTDHGQSYPVTGLVSATGTTPGYLDVDQRSGVVYACHISDQAAFVSRSTDQGQTWATFTADNSTSHGHLFDAVKVGDDGTVYVCWSDDHAVHLAHSTDQAATWSAPVRVSGSESRLAMFPWLEAGSAGRVAVVWYGSTSDVNSNAADWRVWSAITTDAMAAEPTFRIAEVSDHVIHASNLSEGGLTLPVVQPEPNRNLCDYFQVAIDPQGACVVAFSDDHNDYDGHTYLARQIAGPSLYAAAGGGTGQLPAFTPTPLPAPDPGLPEISDFLHDATGNNLQPIPADNPFDILSIDYGCASQNGASLLEVRMKLSDLATVPGEAFWRANFAANAPGPVADRGDQFYLRAATDAGGSPAFTYGTAERDTSGSLVYTERGPATSGLLDPANDEVVMRLSLTALDPWVTHGGGVRAGSVLVGLRGETGTLGAGTARDQTRGGGSITVCQELVGVPPAASPVEMGMGPPVPNPARGGADVSLALSHAAWVDVGVFDAAGRRVRTVHAGTLPAGSTRLHWDARTDAGHPAPGGVYFIRMMAGGSVRTQRLVLVR